MELCLMLCGSLVGRGDWGQMDTCICMAESLHCSSETTTIYSNIKCCCLVSQSWPTLWRPHELQPTRLLCPWDSPSKKTGVDCHSLLQGNLPYSVIEPGSPALQEDSLLSEPPGEHPIYNKRFFFKSNLSNRVMNTCIFFYLEPLPRHISLNFANLFSASLTNLNLKGREHKWSS